MRRAYLPTIPSLEIRAMRITIDDFWSASPRHCLHTYIVARLLALILGMRLASEPAVSPGWVRSGQPASTPPCMHAYMHGPGNLVYYDAYPVLTWPVNVRCGRFSPRSVELRRTEMSRFEPVCTWSVGLSDKSGKSLWVG